MNQKSLIHEITYSTKEFLKILFSLKKENSCSFQNFQKDLLTNYSNNDIDQDILLKLKSLDGTDHRNYSLEETLLEVTNEFEASLEAHAQDFVVELDEIQNVILTLKRILYNDTNDDNYSQSKLCLLEEHVSKCFFFSVKLLDDVRRDLHVMMFKKKIHLSEDLYHEVERFILTFSNKMDTFIFQYQYPGEVQQITNLIDQYRTNSGEDNHIIVQEMIFASFYFFQDRIFPLQSSSIT